MSVRDRTLDISVDSVDLYRVEQVLGVAALLATAIPPPAVEPMSRVFELARVEPVSEVRAQHYRWLVERGWNPTEVYRAAATDPDPVISAWGTSQLVSRDGAFR